MNKITEKMQQLTHDAEAIFAKAKEEGRELTAEENGQWEKMKAELKGLRQTIESEKELAGLAFAKTHEAVTEAKGPKAESFDAKAEREAYNRYLRTGEGREQFVITTGTDSGALVPVSVQTPVIVRKMWNAYITAATIMGQPIIGGESTETIVLPVMDDTSVSGQTTAEDSSTDVAADPSVGTVSLGATLFDSKSVWYSNTQLKALPYDLAAYLMPILDKRVELAQNTAWHTKALTYQAGGNTVTSAATNGITYSEFVQWFHKLGPQFRVDGVFIVSDGLLTVLESLTDNYGRPLLSDPLITGAVKTLRGCPVVIDTAMATPAAAAVSGVFVSAGSIHIRQCDNRRIAIYKDIPTFPDQTGYREFLNADFGLSTGYAFLKHATSGSSSS